MTSQVVGLSPLDLIRPVGGRHLALVNIGPMPSLKTLPALAV